MLAAVFVPLLLSFLAMPGLCRFPRVHVCKYTHMYTIIQIQPVICLGPPRDCVPRDTCIVAFGRSASCVRAALSGTFRAAPSLHRAATAAAICPGASLTTAPQIVHALAVVCERACELARHRVAGKLWWPWGHLHSTVPHSWLLHLCAWVVCVASRQLPGAVSGCSVTLCQGSQ